MAKMPDFEGWAIFAAVVEHRSFSAAATALGLSKGTVSKAITRLETRTGATLFHRTSRRLALTGTGAALAERAAQLLADGQAAEDCAREEVGLPAGRVRLAVPMSFGVAAVAPVIADFLRAHPLVGVDLDLSDAAVDLVGEGFDVALRIAALADSQLRARKLRDVTLRIVAAPTWLDANGRPDDPRQLSEDTCFSYVQRRRREQWMFAHADGREVIVVPSGQLSANNADAMLPAVVAGLGLAVMPDFVCDPVIAEGRLEPLMADWALPRIALHLVTPPGRLRPRRVDVLIAHLADAFGRGQPQLSP